MAGGHQTVVIAIPAIDDAPPGHFRREREELHGIVVGEIMRAAGGKRSGHKPGTAACADGFAPEQCRPADHPQPALARHRLVDHANYRPPLLDERHKGPENRPSGNEARCAVDRVEYPAAPGRSFLDAVFFPDDPVARVFRLDDSSHRSLCRAVGFGHRRGIGLGLTFELGAEKRADGCPGCIGKAFGEFDVGGAHVCDLFVADGMGADRERPHALYPWRRCMKNQVRVGKLRQSGHMLDDRDARPQQGRAPANLGCRKIIHVDRQPGPGKAHPRNAATLSSGMAARSSPSA